MTGGWTLGDVHGGIGLLRYSNAPTGYMTSSGIEQLGDLLTAMDDPAVRVVVLTGDRDGRFITHFAVEELVELARQPRIDARIPRRAIERFQQTLQLISDLDKPVIAAISGDAMGAGLETALACDIRLARAGDHRLGFPEAALGILAAGGGTQRLSRLIGPGRAMDLLLRSKLLRPEQALEFGIVHEVVPDPEQRAMEIAERLRASPAQALAQTKRAVLAGSQLSLEAGLAVEAEAFVATLQAGTARAPMEEFLNIPADGTHLRRHWLAERGAG